MIGPEVLRGEVSKSDLNSSAIWQTKEEADSFNLLAPRSFITLRRDFPYPEFFIESRPGGGFLFGYREPGLAEPSFGREYLFGEIDLEKGSLRFKADIFLNLPFYWKNTGRTFFFSSDQRELLRGKGKSVEFNLPLLAEFLLMKDRYDHQTIFKDLFSLTEREELEWRDGKIERRLPSPSLMEERKEIDDQEAVERFASLLKGAVKRKLALLKGLAIGAELSGGLDSATVAHSLIKTGGLSNLLVFAKLLPDQQRIDQLKRVKEFVSRFQTELVTIDLAEHYPLADQLMEKRAAEIFDPTLEPYRLGVQATARQARKRGVRVLFTGMGGDELFERRFPTTIFFGEEEMQRRQKWIIPDYLTEKITEAFFDRNHIFQSQPIPFLVHSVIRAHQVRNPFFLEAGIWPVSLLADPELVHFCRSLPLRLARHKDFLRLYQKSQSFPPSFYTSEHKDSLYPVMELALKRKRKKLAGQLFRESRLAEMGLVDRDKLLAAYQEYLSSQGRSREYLYEITALELFLRSMEAE